MKTTTRPNTKVQAVKAWVQDLPDDQITEHLLCKVVAQHARSQQLAKLLQGNPKGTEFHFADVKRVFRPPSQKEIAQHELSSANTGAQRICDLLCDLLDAHKEAVRPDKVVGLLHLLQTTVDEYGFDLHRA